MSNNNANLENTAAAAICSKQVSDEPVPMYKSNKYYDLINETKNYQAEVAYILRSIQDQRKSSGRKLLDVACGTGEHLKFFKAHFDCSGLDIDQNFVDIASQKLSGLPVHLGNMSTFVLAEKFDVITCLFSSIGYAKTFDGMVLAVKNMAKHLVPGGVLVIEPWYSPSTYILGHRSMVCSESSSLKVARANFWGGDHKVSAGSSHILINSDQGIEHIEEIHHLGLFTEAEYLDALKFAGVEGNFDSEGPIGRGLVIGVK
jgi:SAM-dependent methyltransferase